MDHYARAREASPFAFYGALIKAAHEALSCRHARAYGLVSDVAADQTGQRS
jgi:hypothetical protein